MAKGEITGFGSGSAYVTYSADGQSYESRVSYESSQMKKGDTISIYYNPEDPQQVSVKMPLFIYSFHGIGILMITAGIVLFLIRSKKMHGRKQLMEEEYCVKAQITEICLNRSIQFYAGILMKLEQCMNIEVMRSL